MLSRRSIELLKCGIRSAEITGMLFKVDKNISLGRKASREVLGCMKSYYLEIPMLIRWDGSVELQSVEGTTRAVNGGLELKVLEEADGGRKGEVKKGNMSPCAAARVYPHSPVMTQFLICPPLL